VTLKLLWLVLAVGMVPPVMRSATMMAVNPILIGNSKMLEKKLLALAGVSEARIAVEECVVYLRVEKEHFDPEEAKPLLQ